MFSFNNPYGACEKCTGLGTFLRVDPELVVPDKSKSIRGGAIRASGWYYKDASTISHMYYDGLAKAYGFTLNTPFEEISEEGQNAILYGTGDRAIDMTRQNEYGTGKYKTTFEGIVNNLERRFRETNSAWMREEIQEVMSSVPCPDSVSYTHLDVYKRQGWGTTSPCSSSKRSPMSCSLFRWDFFSPPSSKR